jgi:hypothetical protein
MYTLRGPGGKSPFINSRRVGRETVQFIPAHDGVTRHREMVPNFQLPMGANQIGVPGVLVIPNVTNSPFTQETVTHESQITNQSNVTDLFSSTVAPNPRNEPQEQIPVIAVADLVRYSDFTNLPFLVGIQPLLILQRSENLRNYVLLINTDLNATGNTIFIGFGAAPTASTGIPIAAVSGSILFDAAVPQNDIWVTASGANTTLLLVYGIKAI